MPEPAAWRYQKITKPMFDLPLPHLGPCHPSRKRRQHYHRHQNYRDLPHLPHQHFQRLQKQQHPAHLLFPPYHRDLNLYRWPQHYRRRLPFQLQRQHLRQQYLEQN